jgi:hypothetical protein
MSTAVMASRSTDGGFTWSDPITLVQHSDGGDDKEVIAADPSDPRYVYAVWDRPVAGTNQLPAWLARTIDGGRSWESAHVMFNPANATTSGHQVVVLPDGTVVDIFDLGQGSRLTVSALRSRDHGISWSSPITINTEGSIGTINVKTRESLRTGSGLPSAASDPHSGAIYTVWGDARFSGNLRDGIAFVKSTDGGLTWTAPVQVNQVPQVQAFTPTVAVGFDGAIAVTYYDFRKDTPDPKTLLTNCWRIVSRDGGATWIETPVGNSFDFETSAIANGARFIGDYQGLAAAGRSFLSFFSATNPGDPSNPSSIFATIADRPGDTSHNGRIEINVRPKRPSATDEERPGPKRNLKH